MIKMGSGRSIDPKNVIQKFRRYFNWRTSVLADFNGEVDIPSE
jgi:hypothetical protein